ncbi:MTH1187 family thiamine-binding protein [Prochlorococcus sp. MIT 1341]|uniref:MTH1187 family thiamine-binding protein n=1 Tax=Prochlorococcus sp. MIT 1341 TaxID=3096221 RepID=UPI002A7657ED|nr:MTH1187 family thiamine-binding protein [Prochlorococcus sp. MIT 1341]
MKSHSQKLWVSIDLCLIPVGTGVSIAPYIKTCQKTIEEAGLNYELGPNGTAIEGNWEEVFDCVKACHTAVHNLGAPRIYTTLKVNTRTDKKQSFTEKVESVIQL